jgi:hypothetical protein
LSKLSLQFCNKENCLMTRVCLDAIYLALYIQQREMSIEEGIAHIKGILNQMKST